MCARGAAGVSARADDYSQSLHTVAELLLLLLLLRSLFSGLDLTNMCHDVTDFWCGAGGQL